MIREAICEGIDVEDALEKAKAALDIGDTDEYDFEVLQREEKKRFGLFGGRPAKVRAFVVIPEKPEDKTETFLRNVLDKMGLESIAIETSLTEESIDFNLSGEEEGFVIGRRGETLDALQYLATIVTNKAEDSRWRVSLDTENYREKRTQALVALANKTANTVTKTGKSIALEPMNPQERRIIHSALQDNKNVTTFSTGQEPRRKIVIAPQGQAAGKKPGKPHHKGGKKR